jgi:hypothetical protein
MLEREKLLYELQFPIEHLNLGLIVVDIQNGFLQFYYISTLIATDSNCQIRSFWM